MGQGVMVMSPPEMFSPLVLVRVVWAWGRTQEEHPTLSVALHAAMLSIRQLEVAW